jgi:cyclic pyranopterin phosphate synthase
MRATGTPNSVASTLEFARRHGMQIYVNLIHYSLPYFVKGVDDSNEFWFQEEDRPILEEIVEILLESKRKEPSLIRNSERGLRSIPDWLIRKSEMRIPCTGYDMIWVGPDGTVQMCFVTFDLGNLHETRLRDMLFNAKHRRHARDAFALNCPNCNCGYDKRVSRHSPSRRLYAG